MTLKDIKKLRKSLGKRREELIREGGINETGDHVEWTIDSIGRKFILLDELEILLKANNSLREFPSTWIALSRIALLLRIGAIQKILQPEMEKMNLPEQAATMA